MNTHMFDKRPKRFAKGFYLLFWFTGFLFGSISAVCHQDVSGAIMHAALLKSPSIIVCLLLSIIRILVFYFAVRYRLSAFIYLLLFMDAFCLGFCGFAIYFAVGKPAWLFQSLFLFSCTWSHIPIWWLLLRDTPYSKKTILLLSAFTCFIVIVDYACISPVLLDLLKYL